MFYITVLSPSISALSVYLCFISILRVSCVFLLWTLCLKKEDDDGDLG